MSILKVDVFSCFLVEILKISCLTGFPTNEDLDLKFKKVSGNASNVFLENL